ncbi:DUF993 family protein [Plantactinospora siamensis]|uniref:DUF993 family protein n=1 Tax=Plantactinospora siamensis TaxID=555372 RepID=A0ABV6P2H4_9ACTN
MSEVVLLDPDGRARPWRLGPPAAPGRPELPLRSRIGYAAAHVVPRVGAENVPGAPADLDWDATLAFRHHLWSTGLGVADAMDTAQRNMGLDPAATRELIARSAAAARSVRGALVVGVNTDHVPDEVIPIRRVIDAYVEQLQYAEDQGAGVVLMASRHLARAAAGPGDYEHVYREVIARAGRPVLLHWLGAAFDAQLHGYFGSADPAAAADVALRIIEHAPDRVRGIKLSLLDAGAEVALRARLPRGVEMFTGDDYHYVDLIAGDGERHSQALLGAFAGIAPLAAAAIAALDAGDPDGYRRLLGPTEPLSRHVFGPPTAYYKTGIAFLAWLNGHQPSFAMVGGLHSGRSLPHLSELVRLADEAGALEDPDQAARRWNALLALHGVARPVRVAVP